jgi:hypothetical protein
VIVRGDRVLLLGESTCHLFALESAPGKMKIKLQDYLKLHGYAKSNKEAKVKKNLATFRRKGFSISPVLSYCAENH